MPATPDGMIGRRSALVIGTSAYADPSLRQLRAPARDAADLEGVLCDPEIGGFTVTSVIDGTAQQVRLAVGDFLADRSPDDLLLVYLSCHGLIDLRRRLFFAATDTRKDRLAATGVESEWVLDQLDDCRARRQVVILDCCFSGAFASRSKGDGDLGLGERLSGQGRGRVVLTASRASEYSFEGKPVPGSAIPSSIFTRALVEGLRSGAADLDRDGFISVDDAYGYVFDRVRSSDAQQTPQRWLYGAEGSITLARSRDGGPLPEPAGPTAVTTRSEPPRASRHRRVLVGAGAALAAVAVAVVTVLLWPDGSGSSVDRLVVEDKGLNGSHPGCTVTLTNTETKETRKIEGLYGTSTFLVPDAKHWRPSVSYPGCEARIVAGPGPMSLPVVHRAHLGDSPAFLASGPVKIEVTDTRGNSQCVLLLHSVQDGKLLDAETVSGAVSTTLDPYGVSPVYIARQACDIRITQA